MRRLLLFDPWIYLNKILDDYFDEERFLNKFKQFYYHKEYPDVIKKIEEFKEEMNQTDYKQKTKLKSLKSLDKSMIERALHYPTDLLVQSPGAKIVKCPFHEDRVPSLDIRNNFFYCYGCGFKGDTIDFVMQKYGLTFKEAVKYLNRL